MRALLLLLFVKADPFIHRSWCRALTGGGLLTGLTCLASSLN